MAAVAIASGMAGVSFTFGLLDRELPLAVRPASGFLDGNAFNVLGTKLGASAEPLFGTLSGRRLSPVKSII